MAWGPLCADQCTRKHLSPTAWTCSRSRPATPTVIGTTVTTEVQLDVLDAIPRQSAAVVGANYFWISLQRTGNADAYAGAIVLVNIGAYYLKWNEGGFILNV